MADPHAEDVGDGIERTGLEHSGLDPELPQARPLGRKGGGEADQGHKKGLKKKGFHVLDFLDQEYIGGFANVK